MYINLLLLQILTNNTRKERLQIRILPPYHLIINREKYDTLFECYT